ncbi:hypothetical protein QMK17_03915 [Rhodococcus sp. G-MC3]|nr:hypothetical protein [Rhodococcus sp. G-MC3]
MVAVGLVTPEGNPGILNLVRTGLATTRPTLEQEPGLGRTVVT